MLEKFDKLKEFIINNFIPYGLILLLLIPISYVISLLMLLSLCRVFCKPLRLHHFGLTNLEKYRVYETYLYKFPSPLNIYQLALIITLILLSPPLYLYLTGDLISFGTIDMFKLGNSIFHIFTLLILITFLTSLEPLYNPMLKNNREAEYVFENTPVKNFRTEIVGSYDPFSETLDIKGLPKEIKDRLLEEIRKILPKEELLKNKQRINPQALDLNNLVVLKANIPFSDKDTKYRVKYYTSNRASLHLYSEGDIYNRYNSPYTIPLTEEEGNPWEKDDSKTDRYYIGNITPDGFKGVYLASFPNR